MINLLDLFCGAGGATIGYLNAGFNVVGIDINDQPEYPSPFIKGNALELIGSMAKNFDVIHASPPCQHFTKYRNCRKDLKSRYQDLLSETREALVATKKPYVIENVVGAPMRSPITLCGSMFGLDVRRHRLFECNFPLKPPQCDHTVWQPNRFPGGRSRERGHARILCRGTVEVGRWNIPIKVQQKAMGISHINNLRMLSEALPPAYTRWLGKQIKNIISR